MNMRATMSELFQNFYDYDLPSEYYIREEGANQNLKRLRRSADTRVKFGEKKRKVDNVAINGTSTAAHMGQNIMTSNKDSNEPTCFHTAPKIKEIGKKQSHKIAVAIENKDRNWRQSAIPKISIHVTSTDSQPFPLITLEQSNYARYHSPGAAEYASLIEKTFRFYDDSVPRELFFELSDSVNVVCSESSSLSSSIGETTSSRSVHDLNRKYQNDIISSKKSQVYKAINVPSFPILGSSITKDSIIIPQEKKTFCASLPKELLPLLRDDTCMFESAIFSLEQALSLSPFARIVVDSIYPFRIIHANAELYRLGVDSSIKITGRPFSDLESTLKILLDSLAVSDTTAGEAEIILPNVSAKLMLVGDNASGNIMGDDCQPSHYLIQLETQQSFASNTNSSLCLGDQPSVPTFVVG